MTRRPRMRVPTMIIAEDGEEQTGPLEDVIDRLRAWARREAAGRSAAPRLVQSLISYVIEQENQAEADWIVKGEIAKMLGIPAGSEIDMSVLRDAIRRRLP